MEKQKIIDAETVILLVFIFLATYASLRTLSYPKNYSANQTSSFQHLILTYAPSFIVGATMHSHSTRNRHTKNSAKLSIFKSRGAARNLAIFRILVASGQLSIGQIQRKLNKTKKAKVTYYATLNRRMHALVRGGYIAEVKPTADQATGFKVCHYKVLAKFYLAYFLSRKSRDEVLNMLKEPNAKAILSELINANSTET